MLVILKLMYLAIEATVKAEILIRAKNFGKDFYNTVGEKSIWCS